MSSYDDRRRRERSWERDERDRDRDRDRDRGRGGQGRGRGRRSSRSRSPPRRSDQTRRDPDYGRDRYDDRRDPGYDRERDRKNDRRRDERRDTDRRDRDINIGKREEEPHLIAERDHYSSRNDRDSLKQTDKDHGYQRDVVPPAPHISTPTNTSTPKNDLNNVPNLKEDGEDGEEMEDDNEDEAAMMAMMGFGGFDSTKGKPVVGNQEGTADVKKPRTWRQYMNRRGGFNRPLDKIK